MQGTGSGLLDTPLSANAVPTKQFMYHCFINFPYPWLTKQEYWNTDRNGEGVFDGGLRPEESNYEPILCLASARG